MAKDQTYKNAQQSSRNPIFITCQTVNNNQMSASLDCSVSVLFVSAEECVDSVMPGIHRGMCTFVLGFALKGAAGLGPSVCPQSAGPPPPSPVPCGLSLVPPPDTHQLPQLLCFVAPEVSSTFALSCIPCPFSWFCFVFVLRQELTRSLSCPGWT